MIAAAWRYARARLELRRIGHPGLTCAEAQELLDRQRPPIPLAEVDDHAVRTAIAYLTAGVGLIRLDDDEDELEAALHRQLLQLAQDAIDDPAAAGATLTALATMVATFLDDILDEDELDELLASAGLEVLK